MASIRIATCLVIGLGMMGLPLLAEQGQPNAASRGAVQESGDPTKLEPDEIRDIWQTLARVELLGAKPAEPAKPTGEDAKIRYVNGLDTYMSLRQAEMAQELGLRAWAIDFEGGPLHCWLEIKESGQQTMPSREPFGDDPGVKEAYWICDAQKGRLLFWFLPGAAKKNPSDRSRRILERLKTYDRSADAIPEVFGLQIVGGRRINHQLKGEPQVPALWSSWNDVSIQEITRAAPAKVIGEVALLAVEATEKGSTKGAEPRKVRLTLKAKPQSE